MTNPSDNIPHFDSKDSEWIAWYKSLRKYGYSKDEANQAFLQAFANRAGDGANTYRLGEFAKKQGFSIDRGYLGGMVDAVGGTSKGIGKMFSNFSGIIALAVILGCFILGFVVYNTIKEQA